MDSQSQTWSREHQGQIFAICINGGLAGLEEAEATGARSIEGFCRCAACLLCRPFFSTPVGTAAGPQALGPKGKGKGKTRLGKSGDGPGKTAKTVNLTREVPKLGQAMEKQLEKVASEIDKNLDMATTAAECIKIASLSLNDRASCSYKVSLQFRHQIMTRWSGDQNTVIMLEAEGHVEEASEVVAPAEEHTPKKARLAEELGGEQDSRGIQKVQDLESWSF